MFSTSQINLIWQKHRIQTDSSTQTVCFCWIGLKSEATNDAKWCCEPLGSRRDEVDRFLAPPEWSHVKLTLNILLLTFFHTSWSPSVPEIRFKAGHSNDTHVSCDFQKEFQGFFDWHLPCRRIDPLTLLSSRSYYFYFLTVFHTQFLWSHYAVFSVTPLDFIFLLPCSFKSEYFSFTAPELSGIGFRLSGCGSRVVYFSSSSVSL